MTCIYTQANYTATNKLTMPYDRKEYMSIYSRQPEVMAKSRLKSINNSLEKKRRNTKKRIQEHTMDELMKIVKEKCIEKNVNFEEKRAECELVLKFLHDI
jgi:hypothetical protein